jgi:catechol-2,3-dioxygenase
LTVAHSTLAARDLDALQNFYCEVLGFEVTNRGPVGDEGLELAFLSQDPGAHHQIAMVGGASTLPSDFVMIDHVAFRTNSLADLRIIRTNLLAAGIEDIMQIDHGNAWSLYFKDPEGNGVECYVDSPFHVAQPYAGTFDVDASDQQIEQATRESIQGEPEFQLMKDWQVNFARRLNQR